MILNAFSAVLAPAVWFLAITISAISSVDIGSTDDGLKLMRFPRNAARLEGVAAANYEAAKVVIKLMGEVAVYQSLAMGIILFFALTYVLPPSNHIHCTHPYGAAVVASVLFLALFSASIFRRIDYLSRLQFYYQKYCEGPSQLPRHEEPTCSR
jgi:hypothetical protein